MALERDRIVAGAYLKRYGSDERVMPDYVDAAEISWLVCLPKKVDAGRALASACVAQLDRWGATKQYAEGDLPTPATYGVPEVWPHVQDLLRNAGFDDSGGRTEILCAGLLEGAGIPGPPPIDGLSITRDVGHLSTRFSAMLHGSMIGYVHVKDDLTRGETLSRLAGWAELWELEVQPEHRRRGVGTWLVRTAVAWLRLGGACRMLADAAPDAPEPEMDRFYARFGWHEICRTRRGWRRK